MRSTKVSAMCAVAAVFLGVCSASLFAQEAPRGELTLAEFEKLHKDVQPPKDELWRSMRR